MEGTGQNTCHSICQGLEVFPSFLSVIPHHPIYIELIFAFEQPMGEWASNERIGEEYLPP